MKEEKSQPVTPEIVSSTEVLSTLVHTEIDMQIATAKKYPRDLPAVMTKIEQLVFMSPEITESCAYALPRREMNPTTNQWETKILQGPSVRLAEIVASCYGNIRAGARVIGNDGRKITSQGFCHDLETNNFVAFEVQRKITTKAGRTYSEDMQIVTGNAASKIAYRNVVFTVVPAALVSSIYEKILTKIKGNEDDLPQRRDKAIRFFTQRGVTDVQLFESLGIKNKEQIDLDKLQVLSGYKAAIANGETTIEDLFPQPEGQKQKQQSGKAEQSTLDLMEGQKKNGKK